MPKKQFNAEQIVTKLRQIDVLMAQGRTAAQACKEAEISEQSYYRWRKEYGGLEIEQARRFKELERENGRLKRLVGQSAVAPLRRPAGPPGRGGGLSADDRDPKAITDGAEGTLALEPPR